MLNQSRHEMTGYTHAVDWWSLGVTMFKLMTGYRPFTDDNFNTFVAMAPSMFNKVEKHFDFPEYSMLFQKVPYPEGISEEAKDLMNGLMNVDDKTRLGSGPNGAKDLRKHPFFNGIDWDLLEQKHIMPPFIPEKSSLFNDLKPFGSFNELLESCNKSQWLDQIPSEASNQHFNNWNFTSTQTIRIESGLSQVMDQYDEKFKVRRLLGDVVDKDKKGSSTNIAKEGGTTKSDSSAPSANTSAANTAPIAPNTEVVK